MATEKTGPVKPPVLDLKAKKAEPKPTSAKPASGAKPSAKTSSESKTSAGGKSKPSNAKPDATTPPPSSPSPSPSRSFVPRPLIAALAGALGGAVITIIIALALSVSGLLQPMFFPAKTPQFIALRERVGANLEQIAQERSDFAALNEKVGALNKQVGDLGLALNQQTKQLLGKIDDLNQKINGVAGQYQGLSNSVAALSAPTDTAFDPGPLEEKIALLGARIDAVAAGASTGDAQKLSADLGAIRNQFAGQRQQLIALKDQLDGIKQPLGDLNTQLAVAKQALGQNQLKISQNAKAIDGLSAKLGAPAVANDSANIANKALQLPLALIGMQSALETGRPFAIELTSLEAVLPGLKIAANLRETAKVGLLRPDQLVAGFEQKLPAMLAARPTSADAGWQQALWERLKAMVALRPSEQGNLSGIDALIADAEGAVSRRDFAAAATAIAKMPTPMQAALGDLGQQIAEMGAMQTLLNEARATALSQGQNQGQKTGADQ